MKKQLYIFFLAQFFFSLYLYYSVSTFFYISRGLVFSQIGLLFTIWFITSVIFEIPTGRFADKYGHNISLSIAAILMSLFCFITAFANDFYIFVMAMIINGIGSSFWSNSGESWLYETLKDFKHTDKYSKFLGINQAINASALVCAGILGGYLFEYTTYLPYAVTGLLFLLPALLYLLLQKPSVYYQKSLGFVSYFDGLKIISQSTSLIYLTILFVTFYLTQDFIKELSGKVYLENIGFSFSQIGIIHSLFWLVEAIVAWQAFRVIKVFSARLILVGLLLLQIIIFLGLSLIHIPIGLGLIGGHYMIKGIVGIVLGEKINSLLPSKQRALCLSCISFVYSLIGLLAFPIMGMIVDQYGLSVSFIVMSIPIVLVLGYAVFGNYKYDDNIGN